MNALPRKAAPAEVELEFEVTIVPHGPVHLLSGDGRLALGELMSRGQAAALAALAGTPPIPATLAARLQVAIDRWDALAKAEKALKLGFRRPHGPEQQDLQAPAAAYDTAKEAFEDAFNVLINRFEKEFPHG